jgi:Flp pilus assembly protein TadG
MRERLIIDSRGGTGAEFALVLPLLLILLFGIIDGGRLLWDMNRAEKATQVGARVAVVTDMSPSGLAAENYLDQTFNGVTLTQGDVIPAEALGDVRCTRTSCTCVSGNCPDAVGTLDADTFDQVLLPRMRNMYPGIDASNIVLHFTGSGLGYAGDPHGSQISPVVTVELTGLEFQPITTLLFATFNLPSFRTSLTGEDLSGSASN